MPYVNIKVAGKLTGDQKKQIASELTATLKKVAGKPPEYTYIVFEEVSHDDWAIAGKLLSDNS